MNSKTRFNEDEMLTSIHDKENRGFVTEDKVCNRLVAWLRLVSDLNWDVCHFP